MGLKMPPAKCRLFCLGTYVLLSLLYRPKRTSITSRETLLGRVYYKIPPYNTDELSVVPRYLGSAMCMPSLAYWTVLLNTIAFENLKSHQVDDTCRYDPAVVNIHLHTCILVVNFSTPYQHRSSQGVTVTSLSRTTLYSHSLQVARVSFDCNT